MTGSWWRLRVNFHDESGRGRFFALVLLYSLYLIALQPAWVLSGEMWAEMATNYFLNARSQDWWVRLFATDEGYIPLPQRLMALFVHQAGFGASAIPYVYTWLAIFASAMLVGVICLKPFRVVIPQDSMRFIVALCALMPVDFESRTFINFTYFVAFFVALVSVLAVKNGRGDVPVWSWMIPLLVLSKPALLATLPLMIGAAVFSGRRFKWITVATVVVFIAQLVQMYISHEQGVFATAEEYSLWAKLLAGLLYTVGYMSMYGGGFLLKLPPVWLLMHGAVIFVAVACFCMRGRNRDALPLVAAGFCLMLFSMMLNCVALSADWNIDLIQLARRKFHRHSLTAYFGALLMVAGMASVLTKPVFNVRFASPQVAVVGLWFLFSGLFFLSLSKSKTPSFPVTGSSAWQQNVGLIESGRVACVPLSPFGWYFPKNCYAVGVLHGQGSSVKFSKNAEKLVLRFDVTVPERPEILDVVSLTVPVKPGVERDIHLRYRAVIHWVDGRRSEIAREQTVSKNGGLLHIPFDQSIAPSTMRSFVLQFDAPLYIGQVVAGDGGSEPAVSWMRFTQR